MSTDAEYVDHTLRSVDRQLQSRGVELTASEKGELAGLLEQGLTRAQREAPDDWKPRFEGALSEMVEKIVARPVEGYYVDIHGRRDYGKYLSPPDGMEPVFAPLPLQLAICPCWPLC